MIKKTAFIIFLFSSLLPAVDPVPYRKVASQGAGLPLSLMPLPGQKQMP